MKLESSSSFAMSRLLRVVLLNAHFIIASIEKAVGRNTSLTLFDDLVGAR